MLELTSINVFGVSLIGRPNTDPAQCNLIVDC